MNGNGNGQSSEDWGAWLRRAVDKGLTAKWDAEYLRPFTVASQVPAQPVGTGAAGQIIVNGQAPMLSPLVLLGGAAALALGLYFVLRD